METQEQNEAVALAVSTAVALERARQAKAELQVSAEDVKVIKSTLASDLNDSEFKLFLFECQRRGVHPMSRLIHPVKRQGKVTFQSSIDYLRAAAESTGMYDGQDAPVYAYKGDGSILSATVTVYRKGQSRGQAATAFFDEYKPAPPNDFMWKKMGHVMIAKCAEALALRKAFPEKLDKIYIGEEMGHGESFDASALPPQATARPPLQEPQAKKHDVVDEKPDAPATPPTPPPPPTPPAAPAAAAAAEPPKAPPKPPKKDCINQKQAARLFAILMSESVRTLDEFKAYLKQQFANERTDCIPIRDYERVEKWITTEQDGDFTVLLLAVRDLLEKHKLSEADFAKMATAGECAVAADCSWNELISMRKKIYAYLKAEKEKEGVK